MTDIATQASDWFLPIIAGAAFADSLNPCAFSILFLTMTFLFSLGKDRKFILAAGGLYIFGIALVYTLIGVGILKVLSFFAVPNVLAKFGAAILIAYGTLAVLQELFPAFPIRLKIPQSAHDRLGRTIHKATFPAAFGLGILVGLFEFPCTGGPYLFVLSLLHDQGTFWSGFGYLLVYNFIFVLPLIVILLVASTPAILEKADRLRKLETKKARIILDLALVTVGVVILIL